MVRVVKDGRPVYFVVALEDIDSFGDATAENLHKSIDHDFQQNLKIANVKYTKALVSATADGASVNTGIYNGLLVRLQQADRPWLVMIHCVSHRLELTAKDTLMKEKAFEKVKQLMIDLYYLMKRSGKFKRHFEATAMAQEIQVYKFPKVHGTRFVGHQRNGARILLNNWIPLAQAIENSIANKLHKKLKSKLEGILKKLRSLQYFNATCLFFDILDIVSAMSLKFEKRQIQACEVLTAVEQTKINLEDLLEEGDTMASVNKAGYTVNANGSTISCALPKQGHMKRNKANREYVSVSLDRMIQVSGSGRRAVSGNTESLKQRVLPALNNCLDARFSSFSSSLYPHMLWINPANWRCDVASELESIKVVADHFSETLEAAGFEDSKIKREWKTLKITQNNFYQGVKMDPFWEHILVYRKLEFPNLCMLVEVVLAIGVSNSSVEAGFSSLTAMLTDRRLSLSHESMEDLLIIKTNDHIWNDGERQSIIDDAVQNYMESKRRKLKLDENPGIPPLGALPKMTKGSYDTSDSEDAATFSAEESDEESSYCTSSDPVSACTDSSDSKNES